MPDEKEARRAYAIITYAGKDISEQISKDLLSLTYTDNTDETDDVQIKLSDKDKNWRGPWYPKVAAKSSK